MNNAQKDISCLRQDSNRSSIYVHDLCGRRPTVAMNGKPKECLTVETGITYRKGDVYIVTFPKTGTTVLQYMCHLLRTQCANDCQQFEDINQVCPHTSSAWFIGQDPNEDQVCPPRLFKSHRDLCQVAPFAPEGYVKFIATIRDPMSTLLSVFSFGKERKSDSDDLKLVQYALSRKWSDQYNEGCISTLFDHFETFYRCIPAENFLLIPFEDLVNEREKWLKLIAEFMAVDTTPAVLKQIAEMTTKEEMLKNISKFDESWCKFKRAELGRIHPFIGAAASKITNGHSELFDRSSTTDIYSILELNKRLWYEKIEKSSSLTCYEDMRKQVNAHYFPYYP